MSKPRRVTLKPAGTLIAASAIMSGRGVLLPRERVPNEAVLILLDDDYRGSSGHAEAKNEGKGDGPPAPAPHAVSNGMDGRDHKGHIGPSRR